MGATATPDVATCNTAIGKLDEDPDLLRRAAEYLERER